MYTLIVITDHLKIIPPLCHDPAFKNINDVLHKIHQCCLSPFCGLSKMIQFLKWASVHAAYWSIYIQWLSWYCVKLIQYNSNEIKHNENVHSCRVTLYGISCHIYYVCKFSFTSVPVDCVSFYNSILLYLYKKYPVGFNLLTYILNKCVNFPLRTSVLVAC